MANYQIDYFELPATAADGTRAFFDKAFGWTFKDYGPDYVEIHGAAVIGGINAHPDDKPAAPLIGIRTDDIIKAEQAVVGAGGTITRPTYDFPGGKRFYFREPSGSEMMVYMEVAA
jgi:predicted enzyme related to lactoylglutathione lyase